MVNKVADTGFNGGKGNIMKNLTISMKLIVGFGIVLFLLILSSVLSMFSITKVVDQVDLYGKFTVPDIDYTWTMRNSMSNIQKHLLGALVVKDATGYQSELDLAAQEATVLHETVELYAKNQRNTSSDAQIENVRSLLDQAATLRTKYADLLGSSMGGKALAQDLFTNEYAPILDQVEGILEEFSASADKSAQAQEIAGDSAANMAWVMLIAVAVVSVLITVIVAFAIRKSILNPVKEIESVYAEIAKGNMQAQISYDSRDEIGSMASSIRKTNNIIGSYIRDITEKLTQMSQGDMRINVDLDYIGDFEAIKNAMQNMASELNHTLLTINTAAEQVSTGSSQVASGAQALATGSTEQASSVEQLSVSITKIAEQAAENSSNVKVATQYVEQTAANVKDGSEHMKQLTEAMTNIGSASNQIANITKVIEDIAFQTNILALNAAIEAARAGNAGKGFAVVADEVRNLAGKSAEAAKQTADLIRRSVATVADGTQITSQTAQILKNVEEKANLVNESIVKIHQASSEQAVAIEQVKQGLTQVSAVVQTNAATAEENSATSEEMSAQAATLREEVGKFKLDSGYEKDSIASISLFKEPSAAKKPGLKAASALGKY
jgi:methyl-accepting chemotaxis protein